MRVFVASKNAKGPAELVFNPIGEETLVLARFELDNLVLGNSGASIRVIVDEILDCYIRVSFGDEETASAGYAWARHQDYSSIDSSLKVITMLGNKGFNFGKVSCVIDDNDEMSHITPLDDDSIWSGGDSLQGISSEYSFRLVKWLRINQKIDCSKKP